MSAPLLTILILPLLHCYTARVALYGACDIANNHLDVNTKAFETDCDSFGFCTSNGTCFPRQCRRDEYVLTSLLDASIPTPPLCPEGMFCPDDASGCLPWVPLGGRCELNRDDECEPPSTPFAVKPDEVGVGKGAICLLGVCMWENVGLGGTCETESATYTGFDTDGTAFNTSITRDNCIEGQGYCNVTMTQCLPVKDVGDSCWEDQECGSYTCTAQTQQDGSSLVGNCVDPPNSRVHIPRWLYGLSSTGLIIATGMILWGLVRMHRQSEEAQLKIMEEYQKQQTSYRTSIMSMHSLAMREKGEVARTMSKRSEASVKYVNSIIRPLDDGVSRGSSNDAKVV
ncbi:hypothetical protein M231_05670 [Tremella mesenterica]|uniref:Dickkopf N-terminal cysteine-rich domain-containing protein n=1 Tax=Tremella mesenterica TaxID=5217 RepID=A0A4Q1BHK6_TREME|nr:hypothetical protein M231_05670 [Tremella mesenterica]